MWSVLISGLVRINVVLSAGRDLENLHSLISFDYFLFRVDIEAHLNKDYTET